jgi:peptidoglycan/LPS O-acetylase OafA/YrhL
MKRVTAQREAPPEAGTLPAPTTSDFRPEIQALRAVAVVLVVLFHLWPDRLTGGFVGVDVFFAISGYLITGHLLRENASPAGISLLSFWARRIRRLTPAAVLVLLVTLAATVIFLPQRVWQDTTQQIGASAIGLQNWLLASNSVDYFASTNQPTGVQHYWSLSLEEQFYLFWPVALVVLFLAVRRRSARIRAIATAALMGVVAIGSLVYSILDSAASPAAAYFSTFTHGWEFALGGLLSFATPWLGHSAWSRAPRVRAVASWVGFLAIVAAALTFTGHSAFPGWIALLPIGGALLVIAAGMSTSRLQRPLFLASPPVQWIGSWSYSIYLWHWPLIVIVPFALAHPLGLKAKLVILAVSILLGAVTKRFVEDPARRARFLVRRRWLSYASLVVAAGLVVASSVTVSNLAAAAGAQAQKDAQTAIAAALSGADPCFGAPAMLGTVSCPDSHRVRPTFGPDFAADDWGSIAGVTKDGALPNTFGCVDFSGTGAGFLDCTLGNPTGKTTIAIVGDSHALALFEPLEKIAEAHGWKVRGIIRNSCTPSLPMHYAPAGTKADCNQWRADVAKRIAADPAISLVVATGFTRGGAEAAFRGTHADLVADYTGLWSRWTAAGKKVVAIEDVPLTAGASIPDCVAAAGQVDDPCTVPRAAGLADDPVADAASANADPDVSFVNLDGAFCDPTTCHSVIGGLIAYRDFHHLSATFALTLVPVLDAALTSSRKG